MKRCTFKKISFQLAFMILTGSTKLAANPVSPIVMAGTAQFENTNASTLTVKTGDRVVINWDSFSINQGELTRFVQPNKNSAALNRVTGGSRSEIFGALDANGRVYLINPNGILIDKDSQINAAAFLASTLDVTDAGFIQNGDLLFTGDSKNAVINLGTINAFDGDVILLGFQVDNQGKIIAPNGTAGLAAGQEILLQVGGDKKFLIRPKKESTKTDLTGVNMGGLIQALRTEIQADGHPYNLAINHTGMIDATNIVSKNGQVYLCASDGNTSINGAINAHGGEVEIFGNIVGMFDNTKIDTSYAGGGGNVYIGGGYQGSDTSKINAFKTYASPGVEIVSDALVTGNAGEVIVWSNEYTDFSGNISAKGGAESGNGGFVEISSHGVLGFNGTADRSAENGTGGTLLLDPRSITITGTGFTANITTTAYGPVEVFTVTNPANLANVVTSSINTALATGPLVIRTQPDSGNDVGDIIWQENSDLTVTSPYDLTLESYHDIYMSSLFTNNGNGGFVLTAANDITLVNTDPATTSVGVGAALSGTREITLTGNNISLLSSVVPVELTNVGNPFNGNITINASGGYTQQGGSVANATTRVSSTAGNIYLNALGGDAFIQGGTASTTQVTLNSGAENVVINVPAGSLYLEAGTAGSPSSAEISAGLETSINTGLDLNVIGGAADFNFANIQGTTVVVTTGRDLNVEGGSGTSSSATILSTNDGSFVVGNNLLIQGGSATGASAQIAGVLGSLTFQVAGDVNLISGSAADVCYAQIGNNITGGSLDISFNSIGGDLNLISNAADTFVQDYAAIGNGSIGTTEDALSGNISITGATGSNMTLQGGENSFVQIGNFNAIAVSGDISINGFGQEINLYPGGSNAIIGNGTILPTGLTGVANPTTIIGNINIDLPGGDIYLNPGTGTNSFALIGHYNPITSAQGDININIGSGEISLQPSSDTLAAFDTANSTIGYLNTTNLPIVSGEINVNAGTVSLLGGLSASLGSTIGYISTSSIDIGIANPGTSSIAVVAQGNILLQAGGTSLDAAAGNAIIGQQQFTGGTNFLNSIAVTSLNGNITLVGSAPNGGFNGIALIGSVAAAPLPDAVQPQSAITINAPNGTLGLWGVAPGAIAGGGSAVISTNALTQPYNLNISAGSVELVGGNTNTLIPSIAEIYSPQNTNITTVNDLELDASNGSALIITGAGPSTFTVGGSVILTGGPTSNSIASIGNTAPVTTSADLTFTNVGNDVLLQAGTGANAYAQIGHGYVTNDTGAGSFIGNIVFDNVGGNVTILGQGAAGIDGAYAQIGHTGSNLNTEGAASNPLSGDIIFTNIDGAVTLTAGTGTNSTAIIGHGNELTLNAGSLVDGSIAVNAGSVALNGGINTGSNAVIGYDFSAAQTPVIASSGITVTSADGVTLTGGLGNGTTINGGSTVIGYFNPTQASNVIIDTINVTAKSGDIVLSAPFSVTTTNTNAAFIGTTVAAGGIGRSEIKVTTPGNLILQVPTGAGPGLAAIYNSSPNTQNGLDVMIDPAEVILRSGTNTPGGTAAIYSSNNLNLDFVDSLDINYDPANPTTLQTGTAFVRAFNSIFVNTDKASLGTVTIQGAASLGPVTILEALNGDIIFGTRHSTGAGIINVGSDTQVGTAQINADAGNIWANVQGPVNVTGGTLLGSNSSISSGKNLYINSVENINLTSGDLGGSLITASVGNLKLVTKNDVNNSGIISNIGNSNGYLSVIAGGNINVPGGTIENLGNGDVNLDAGQDVNVTDFATISELGTGDANVTAGRDFNLNDASLLSGGGITANTGRDILLTNGATVSQTGANNGGIEMNAGRDLTVTTTTDSITTISQSGTGNTTLTAGQDYLMNAGSILNTNGLNTTISAVRDNTITGAGTSIVQTAPSGEFKASAGENLNITAGVSITTNALSAAFTAGQDLTISASVINHTGTSTFTMTAGEDANIVNGASVATAAESASFTSGQDFNVTGSTIAQIGTSTFNLNAGEDLNMTTVGSIATAAEAASVTAGQDINLTGGSSINHTGTSTFNTNAGEDLTLTDSGITTAADSSTVTAAQDINLTGSAITGTGASTFDVTAGESLTQTDAGIITSANSASVTAAQDITLTGSGVIHTGTSTFNMQAGEDLTATTSSITTDAAVATVGAGQDVSLSNAILLQLGAEELDVNAGQSLLVQNGAAIETNADVANIHANKDVTVSGLGSSIQQAGTESLDLSAGKNLSVSDDGLIDTNADDTTLSAGQDATFSDTAMIIQNGDNNFHLNAGDNATFNDAASVTTAANQAYIDAGEDISFNGANSFTQTGNSIFNFTAGEDVNVGGSTTILTHAKDATITAHDDVTFSGTSSLTQPGNKNILNITSGGYLTFTDFTKVTTSANALTLDAALDVTFSGNSVVNQTGESTLAVSAEDLIMDDNGRLTTNSLAATFDIAVDMILSGNAEINFNSDGVQTYNVGQDIELHDNSFISTITGTSFFNAGRDFVMTGRSKILNFDSRRLEIHALDNIDLSDHALIESFGGELLAVANYNMTLDDYAEINNTFGNITLVVDNQFPVPPFFGDGSFKLLRHSEVNAPNGTIRIFTSRREFNVIDGKINGFHFYSRDQGVLFEDNLFEQYCTYFDHAIKGHPFTIFYKECGVPHYPPAPLTPARYEQYIAAISEGFHDWKYFDYFDYALLCMDIIDDCYPRGTCCVEYDAMHLKLLREVFHNRHTIKYNLPF